jgi:hypothetical protein
MADGAWQDGCAAYVTHQDFDRFVIAPHHPDRLGAQCARMADWRGVGPRPKLRPAVYFTLKGSLQNETRWLRADWSEAV